MLQIYRSTFLLVVLFGLTLCGPSYDQPEQVHLSYGAGHQEMWVTWLTQKSPAGKSTVQFGFEPTALKMTQEGNSVSFTTSYTRHTHRVLLKNLKPDTVYYYRCGTPESGWSQIFRFRTRPANEENWSPKIGVYGDMGYENGISIPFLKQQVSKGAYDAIFHVGDIAYNLQTSGGALGDKFMREIEPITAHLPYQVVVGNHEEDGYNFTDYLNRFTMVNEDSGEMNNNFFSFNIGPAHVIGFSSEFYYYTHYGMSQIRNQYEWLEKDLIEANKPENRARRPWIMAMGHRPMYCSTADADDCTSNESILRKGIPIVAEYGLEDLFYKYGVDIIFGAHEHTYERLFPVYDRNVFNGTVDDPYNKPKAPVHILVGSAGCPELVDPFVLNPKPWSAKRISQYGVTEMVIHNKTHISFEQRDTSTKSGKVVDSFRIIKGSWN